MAKRYKVWIEIEEHDEDKGISETLDAPGASLVSFDTYEKAWDYAERLTKVAETHPDLVYL